MKDVGNLVVRAIDEPHTLAHLSVSENRKVLLKLLVATGAALAKWVSDAEADQIEQLRARGDRLLDTKEMAARIGCSIATLQRGWKSGRYRFMLKDGGRLVGSEYGLERWIKNRTNRRSA